MQAIIVYAHPNNKTSFNAEILKTTKETFQQKGKTSELIDLNQEQFNPILNQEELSLYDQGAFVEESVRQYQTIIQNSDEIVLIFPIWWYGLPTILKGFFEKVFLPGFAFEFGEEGSERLVPLLTIQKTTVITTSEAKTTELRQKYGNPIEGTLINGTFEEVGLLNGHWLNCDETPTGTEERRRSFLREIHTYLLST
ncbi:NAD(P)H-dependent oxidoreductase [Shouchella shacheensis]|uniref:NAD(P)H-dependent oxidoreductase n=1 Tax=Shouchella shacheensis TaxID=1649580 RepID=UPI00073FAC5D|nr:NAD(P)H-dependent oxidoreductase [Shouchella shacheensis]